MQPQLTTPEAFAHAVALTQMENRLSDLLYRNMSWELIPPPTDTESNSDSTAHQDRDFVPPALPYSACSRCGRQTLSFCNQCRGYVHLACSCQCQGPRRALWMNYGALLERMAPAQQIYPLLLPAWQRVSRTQHRRLRRLSTHYADLRDKLDNVIRVLQSVRAFRCPPAPPVPIDPMHLQDAAHTMRDVLAWVEDFQRRSEPTLRTPYVTRTGFAFIQNKLLREDRHDTDSMEAPTEEENCDEDDDDDPIEDTE